MNYQDLKKIFKKLVSYEILILFFLTCFLKPPLAKSEIKVILNDMKACLAGEKKIRECNELILLTENIQIKEYQKGNFKCQTSLLGVQTELIRRNYFYTKKNKQISEITIKHVIKNC